jgi:hypothetical protein
MVLQVEAVAIDGWKSTSEERSSIAEIISTPDFAVRLDRLPVIFGLIALRFNRFNASATA